MIWAWLLAQQLVTLTLSFQPVAQVITLDRSKTLYDTRKRDRDEIFQDLKSTKDVILDLKLLEESVKDVGVVSYTELTKLQSLEQRFGEIASVPICPDGLSMEDYQAAIKVFANLPLSFKLGFYLALEMSSDTLPYPTVAQYPEIVSRLYEQRQQLTVQKLETSIQKAQTLLRVRVASSLPDGTVSINTRKIEAVDADELVSQLFGGSSVDQIQLDNVVKQQLGRVTRKDGSGATSKDLDTLLSVLTDKTIFSVEGSAEAIPGGYILRGVLSKQISEPKKLIATLDKRLPPNWNAQVSFIPDITSTANGESSGKSKMPILLLLNKDFSSDSDWIRPLSAGFASFTTFLYALSVYSQNEEVAAQLADRSALGDVPGLDVFNGHLFEVFLPLIFIQLLHEAGHRVIAQQGKFEISLPVLIPFYNWLPNLGFRTDIRSSPSNLTYLFDFAFIGPFIGILTSLIFLIYGIQETNLADSEMLKSFPGLSVSDLKLSALGSGIIDYLYGGQGLLTNQDPSVVVPLHPFAIGGFAGLIIQSIEMLPLGSTDGGRISQALFGRSGHLLVGGATWFALLVASLFVDRNTDLLLGAWALNNVIQNDMEIPCREEISQVDLLRTSAGFSLWFLALLSIIPVQ